MKGALLVRNKKGKHFFTKSDWKQICVMIDSSLPFFLDEKITIDATRILLCDEHVVKHKLTA